MRLAAGFATILAQVGEDPMAEYAGRGRQSGVLHQNTTKIRWSWFVVDSREFFLREDEKIKRANKNISFNLNVQEPNNKFLC